MYLCLMWSNIFLFVCLFAILFVFAFQEGQKVKFHFLMSLSPFCVSVKTRWKECSAKLSFHFLLLTYSDHIFGKIFLQLSCKALFLAYNLSLPSNIFAKHVFLFSKQVLFPTSKAAFSI